MEAVYSLGQMELICIQYIQLMLKYRTCITYSQLLDLLKNFILQGNIENITQSNYTYLMEWKFARPCHKSDQKKSVRRNVSHQAFQYFLLHAILHPNPYEEIARNCNL